MLRPEIYRAKLSERNCDFIRSLFLLIRFFIPCVFSGLIARLVLSDEIFVTQLARDVTNQKVKKGEKTDET